MPVLKGAVPDMEILTPIKAIRSKCLSCCCGQVKEVRECAVKTCALWPYRLGKRPKKVNTNEAQASK